MFDILLAIFAAIVIVKLIQTLGTVDENETILGKDFFEDPQDIEKIIDIDVASKLEAEFDENSRVIFDEIRQNIPDFTLEKFIDMAKKAFKTIFTSFNGNNKTALKVLCDKNIFKVFEKEIQRRSESGHLHENILVGVKTCKLLSISKKNNQIIATLEFETEQINSIKDKQGNLLSGDPSKVNAIKDVWSFARPANSSEPMWTLIAT